MIETCEVCTICGEVTPHSRRRWAPLKLAAGIVLALALALIVAALLVGGSVGVAAGALGLVALLPAAAGLWHADSALRWDLACTRCRVKAIAAARPARPRIRLPLHTTTIDPF